MNEFNADSEPAEPTAPARQPAPWERDLIGQIALEGLREHRRARRWGIFFKLLFAFYMFLLLLLIVWSDSMDGGYGQLGKLTDAGKRHTGLVKVEGIIASDTPANANNIVTGLREAFESDASAGVILRINSPGGSPVEAGRVNDEIRRLREEYQDKFIYTVVEEICTSGGYYIAAATDGIVADKASIVGSIGVILASFGFVEALEKLGIERRVLTAGENKALFDPFSPQRSEEVQHLQSMLDDIHRQFIEAVQEGRGERLNGDGQAFSGLVWTGEQGLEVGLVDYLGDADYVASELIGAEDIVDYTHTGYGFWEEVFYEAGRILAQGFVSGLAPVLR